MLAEEHNQPSHKCIAVDVSTAVSRRERKPLFWGGSAQHLSLLAAAFRDLASQPQPERR